MDVVKALKEIVQNHAEALSDDKKLRAMLKDYFPEDKRTQNTLLMVVDEGILDDMQGKSRINKFQMFGYIKGIASDYGVSEAVAKTAIMNWAKALGIDAEDVPVSFAENSGSSIKQKGSIVDYSDTDLSSYASSGLTLKFSSSDPTKIVPGVKLEKILYIVKATGAPTVNFYDATNRKHTVIIASEPKEEKMFDASRIDTSKTGMMEIKDTSGRWTVELIPVKN